MTEKDRSLIARIAAHESWARTADRSARTSRARKAFADRFERQVREAFPDLDDAEVAVRAEAAKKAHYRELAQKGVEARRAKAKSRKTGDPSADKRKRDDHARTAEALRTSTSPPRPTRKLGDVPTAEWRAALNLPPLMPGGESTSARLRRVEQERDEWLAAARSWSDRYAEACRAGHVLQAELGAARIAARRSDDLARSLHAELEQERARRAEVVAVAVLRWLDQAPTDGGEGSG